MADDKPPTLIKLRAISRRVTHAASEREIPAVEIVRYDDAEDRSTYQPIAFVNFMTAVTLATDLSRAVIEILHSQKDVPRFRAALGEAVESLEKCGCQKCGETHAFLAGATMLAEDAGEAAGETIH